MPLARRWSQILGRRGRADPTKTVPLNNAVSSPALPSRRRALTIAAENPQLVVHGQMQSCLFSKLPFDVRYLIYKEVLAGWIMCLDPPLSATRSRLYSKGKRVACYQYGRHTIWDAERVCAPKFHLLPLLKTCRRVYSEAINILYSENIFGVSAPDPLLCFLTNIQPQRLKAIRALRISVGMIFVPSRTAILRTGYETWARAWEAIKALPSLGTLEFWASSLNSLKFTYRSNQDLMDLDSVSAANPRLQFYLIIYEDQIPLTGLPAPPPGCTLRVMALVLIAPLQTHAVRAALDDLRESDLGRKPQKIHSQPYQT